MPSYLTLLFILLDVGVVLCVAVIWLVARVTLRPPRMDDGRAAWLLKRLSPGDLGLAYEDVEFIVADVQAERKRRPGKLRLAGWWIGHPAAEGRCVVLLHGYADAKVGAIAWAPLFHDLQVNVLALDLRAHGESGGVYSTGGYFERHDVAQVIDQLRLTRPAEARRVVLFGISLGAAVAAAVAATENRDVDGVILESPFVDYRTAVTQHARIIGMPAPLLVRAAIRLAEEISGARFDEVRPVDLVRLVPCPLMVIHGEEDLFVSEADARAIEAATAQRPGSAGASVYWRVADAHHVAALYADPEEYQERVGAFLEMVWERVGKTEG